MPAATADRPYANPVLELFFPAETPSAEAVRRLDDKTDDEP
jgi:hypothetical protein